MFMHDFFIASRFRNHSAVLELARGIRRTGKTVYCFLESDASTRHVGQLDRDPQESMKKFEEIPDWRNSPTVLEVFSTDMNALKSSETVILLLPAGKSAHIEAGVAYGLRKKLILIGEQKETESLYLIFDEVYKSIDEFLNNLS